MIAVDLFKCCVETCRNEGVYEIKLEPNENGESETIYFCESCARECLEPIPTIN